MSEGELGKRLPSKANCNDKETTEILAEAKKELTTDHMFYNYRSDEEPSKVTEYICINFAVFKKWFGEPPAVISQVTGGCAGHIDLKKLKDLEKHEEP